MFQIVESGMLDLSKRFGNDYELKHDVIYFQLSQQNLIEVAKIIRLHGISGGIAQIRKVSMSNPTKPTTEFKFFNDDSSQFNIEGDLIKTEDLEIEEFATSWKPCDTGKFHAYSSCKHVRN